MSSSSSMDEATRVLLEELGDPGRERVAGIRSVA